MTFLIQTKSWKTLKSSKDDEDYPKVFDLAFLSGTRNSCSFTTITGIIANFSAVLGKNCQIKLEEFSHICVLLESFEELY